MVAGWCVIVYGSLPLKPVLSIFPSVSGDIVWRGRNPFIDINSCFFGRRHFESETDLRIHINIYSMDRRGSVIDEFFPFKLIYFLET